MNGFAEAVREGLTRAQKSVPPRYFYDSAGSALYEEITQLPEYYPTRTEATILQAHGAEILRCVGDFDHLIELGSGSSAKTRLLLSAMEPAGRAVTYHPVDISQAAIEQSVQALRTEYPQLQVVGHIGEYAGVLHGLAGQTPGRRVVLFLGSSIGNFNGREVASFLGNVRGYMRPGEAFVLGTDMVKDVATMEAAYDDSQGVTARFNLNLLVRMNRELDADFDVETFEHRAVFNAEQSRIEMHLVSRRDQTVRIGALDLSVDFAAGESIHTENSYKYTPEGLASMAAEAGFETDRSWFDPRSWFGVHVWRRA